MSHYVCRILLNVLLLCCFTVGVINAEELTQEELNAKYCPKTFKYDADTTWCYSRPFKASMKYYESEAYCLGLHATLPTLNTPAEHEYFRSRVPNVPNYEDYQHEKMATGYWINSMYDFDTERFTTREIEDRLPYELKAKSIYKDYHRFVFNYAPEAFVRQGYRKGNWTRLSNSQPYHIICQRPSLKSASVIVGKASEWGSWESCSTSCGRGKQMRRKKCQAVEPRMEGGQICRENLYEFRECVRNNANRHCECRDGWVPAGMLCYKLIHNLQQFNFSTADKKCKEIGGRLPIPMSEKQKEKLIYAVHIEVLFNVSQWPMETRTIWLNQFRQNLHGHKMDYKYKVIKHMWENGSEADEESKRYLNVDVMEDEKKCVRLIIYFDAVPRMRIGEVLQTYNDSLCTDTAYAVCEDVPFKKQSYFSSWEEWTKCYQTCDGFRYRKRKCVKFRSYQECEDPHIRMETEPCAFNQLYPYCEGCDTGWTFAGKFCYLLTHKFTTFNESEQECRNLGGHLASFADWSDWKLFTLNFDLSTVGEAAWLGDTLPLVFPNVTVPWYSLQGDTKNSMTFTTDRKGLFDCVMIENIDEIGDKHPQDFLKFGKCDLKTLQWRHGICQKLRKFRICQDDEIFFGRYCYHLAHWTQSYTSGYNYCLNLRGSRVSNLAILKHPYDVEFFNTKLIPFVPDSRPDTHSCYWLYMTRIGDPKDVGRNGSFVWGKNEEDIVPLTGPGQNWARGFPRLGTISSGTQAACVLYARYQKEANRGEWVDKYDLLRDNYRAACQAKPLTAIDGNWGGWGRWSDCSRKCGDAFSTRSRLCNNPSPRLGRDCHPPTSVEARNCRVGDCDHCPVGWIWLNVTGKCFGIPSTFRGETLRLSKNEAAEICKANGAKLLTNLTKVEIDFVYKNMGRILKFDVTNNTVMTSFWLDISRTGHGEIFKWGSNENDATTEVNDLMFAQGQPVELKGEKGMHCVAVTAGLLSHDPDNGKWFSRVCDGSYGLHVPVCMTDAV